MDHRAQKLPLISFSLRILHHLSKSQAYSSFTKLISVFLGLPEGRWKWFPCLSGHNLPTTGFLYALKVTQILSLVGKIPWRTKWQPTLVFLPGKFHRQRSLAGYSPWSCRVGHDWVRAHIHTDTHTDTHTHTVTQALLLWDPCPPLAHAVSLPSPPRGALPTQLHSPLSLVSLTVWGKTKEKINTSSCVCMWIWRREWQDERRGDFFPIYWGNWAFKT